MNQEHMDDLKPTPTPLLARRQALRLLAGSAVGGMLAIMDIGNARAKDKEKKRKCCKNGCCKDGCCMGEAKCKCCKDDCCAEGSCADGCCAEGSCRM